MKKLLLIVFLCSLQSVFASEVIQSFIVSRTNPNMQKIADEFEIKDRMPDSFLVYVVKERVAEFRKLAPKSIMISADINAHLKSNKSLLKGYHSIDEVTAKYEQFAKTYPDYAKIEKYGTSAGGRELFALKISDNVNKVESEPKLMITSATHGDELITVEVQLRLVEELLSSSDPRLRRMIEEHELFFIPMVNPDGFARRSRYASGRVDPNRDYPWPDRPHHVNKVTSIKHLIDFYHKHDFQGSMDIHASGKMVMFPWAYTRDEISPADFKFMDKLTESMAKENNYRHGPISKVIYVAKGSSADYYYWKNGGVALAIELTTTKVPRASRIPKVVDEAREMMWKFIEAF